MTRLQASILNAVNDLVSVRPHRGGELVTTSLRFSDGDSIEIWVDRMSGSFRVTDRAEALDRLEMWGVRTNQGKAAEAIVAARTAAALNPFGAVPEELSTICSPEELGVTVLAVAEAAMRVEQLRWLAHDRPALKFDDRLAGRLESLSLSRRWRMTRRAKISIEGGRERRITAAIEGPHGTAYVQAVSDADKERAAEHCYYLFDRSEASKSHQVAALAGASRSWPSGLQDDLERVGRVAFFDDPLGLERELDAATGATPTVWAPDRD